LLVFRQETAQELEIEGEFHLLKNERRLKLAGMTLWYLCMDKTCLETLFLRSRNLHVLTQRNRRVANAATTLVKQRESERCLLENRKGKNRPFTCKTCNVPKCPGWNQAARTGGTCTWYYTVRFSRRWNGYVAKFVAPRLDSMKSNRAGNIEWTILKCDSFFSAW